MTGGRPNHESPFVPVALVAVTVVAMVAVGTRILDIHVLIGPWFLHHWISWAGVLFIGVFTPIFYVSKRRRTSRYSRVLNVHVFGGLLSAALIALHFTQHVTRPVEFYPDLGTGIVLSAALALSVATGLLIRHRWLSGAMREWRALHSGAAVAFYLTIAVHVLEGLGVL